MKAVIVECSNGAAVALCDDGSFRKLKNKGYSIGQELLIKQKATPNYMMQKLSICASLALVLLSCLGIGSYSYVKPYSYVSLDINPSIEYALNRYDKVIAVSGINERGQQVVSSIESDIKNQNITTALGVTIRQLEKENYIIQKEHNHVIVSVCSTNDTKAQSIASRLDNLSAETSNVCLIDTMTVSREVKNNADSLGITPAKLALINAVAETSSDSNFDVSEWTELTVSELEHTIQQACSQSPDDKGHPVTVTVIDSEYLSSVLDDNTAVISDSNSTSSAMEANAENGSATTDKNTNHKNETTTGSGTDETVSDSKLNHTNNASAAEGSPASGKDDVADQPAVPDAGGDTANDPGSGSGQATSPVKTDSDKGQTDSSSNQTTGPSDTNNGQADEDDVLKEDSSNKKDSYPSSDTDQMEDFTDPKEPETGNTEEVNGSSVSNKTDVSDKTDVSNEAGEFVESIGSYKTNESGCADKTNDTDDNHDINETNDKNDTDNANDIDDADEVNETNEKDSLTDEKIESSVSAMQ